MRVVSKVQSMGRGATFGAVAGLLAGLALAMPGAPGPASVLHAVMAASGSPEPSTSTTSPSSPTTAPPTTGHRHRTTEPGPTTTAPPAAPPTTGAPGTTTTSVAGELGAGASGPTSTTTAPGGTTAPGATPGPSGTTAPDGTTAPATCAGRITSFTVALVDGGRGIRITVLVSGTVGWMSADAPGFGGAALAPIEGGFQGTVTGNGPVPPGTEVLVGSCHNHVKASTVVGGGDGSPATGGATTPTTAGPVTTTTTAVTKRSDLPAGCATASITSVSAVIGDGGHSVTVTVLVDGSVGWMSGEVNGVGGITLAAVPGGFAGTLTSATPVAPGTTVVVGTCGGKLRATATVTAGA
jgi:hypothetical protein